MLDRDMIKALKADVGDTAFDEIIDLFLQEIDPKIDELRRGEVPDATDLHFLRSGALNVGLCDFAEACATGEKIAEAGRQDEIDLPSLLHAYDLARSALMEEFTSKRPV